MRRIFRRHLTDRPQGPRQILRADDDQRNGADHHYLTPAHVQHGVAPTLPLRCNDVSLATRRADQPILCSVVAVVVVAVDDV